MDMVVQTCDPRYIVGICRKIKLCYSTQEKIMRPYLKNKLEHRELEAWLKQ
jgi:hypothetical protein